MKLYNLLLHADSIIAYPSITHESTYQRSDHIPQKVGSLSPGIYRRVTPELSIMANRITPPLEPSRDIASASATTS